MASTFFGLDIAYSGLQAANTSLNVTGHNVSNIDTEGYSRESAVRTATTPIRTHNSYGTLGAGVTVTEITQTRDTYYDAKYRNNQAFLGEYDAKNNYTSQVEDYLNEFLLSGFTKEYSNFNAAVNQLTITPGDQSSKNQLINNAPSLADYFNTLSTNLRNVQTDANNEVKDAVEKVNSLAKNIMRLNRQINQIEANYGNANDLRDKRNSMVDSLSKIVNVSTSEVSIGNGLYDFSVRINGQTLVDGYQYNQLETVTRTEKRNASDAAGLYDIRWTTGQTFDIYSDDLGGQLRGLIDIRDGSNNEIESIALDADGNNVTDSEGNLLYTSTDVPKDNSSFKGVPFYLSQLNQFISTFADEVNKIMRTGYSSDGKYEGIPMFVTRGQNIMNASTVTVNPDLLEDANKLAIKTELNTGEADAKVMEALAQLAKSNKFDGGNPSFYLETIVSDESIDAQKANNLYKNYNNLKTTIQNQRLSIMGVDSDEEAMAMIQYQRTYNLNAKMMSVMRQIYDKLINQTGV